MQTRANSRLVPPSFKVERSCNGESLQTLLNRQKKDATKGSGKHAVRNGIGWRKGPVLSVGAR